MERFELGDAERVRRARDAFADEKLAQELLAAPPAGPAIGPSRLYAYARRGDGTADLGVERALRASPKLRRLYARFVFDSARYHAAAAMAAGSTEVPPRAGQGWRISAERSQAEPDQFIVIIELAAGDDTAEAELPDTLILCDPDQAFHHFAVPAARRGVIQMILDADGDLIRLLRDPRTEAFLR